MKKLLTALFLIWAFCSNAQTIRTNPLPNFQQLGSSATLTRVNGVLYPVVGFAPSLYTDTTAANSGSIKGIPFVQISTSSDGKNWYRSVDTLKWQEIGSGWGIAGNTVQTNNFIGSVNNRGFSIKTNNTGRGYIDSLGTVHFLNASGQATQVVLGSASTRPWVTTYGRQHLFDSSTNFQIRVKTHSGASAQLLIYDETQGNPGYGYKNGLLQMRPGIPNFSNAYYHYSTGIGKLNTTRNLALISYFHHNDGSDSNYLGFHHWGASTYALVYSFRNKVGVGGVTYPDSVLQINGSLYSNGGVRFSGVPLGIPSVTTPFSLYVDGNGTVFKDSVASTAVLTYTPTLTNTTNIDSSTAFTTYYKVEGEWVHVWGEVELNPTAGSTLTVLEMSIPTGATFSASRELAGTAATDDNSVAQIKGSTSNARAIFGLTPNHVNMATYSFTFSYKIVNP